MEEKSVLSPFAQLVEKCIEEVKEELGKENKV